MLPADRPSREEPAGRLEVFVGAHCFGCIEARRLAQAAAHRFPTLVVSVIDLEREPAARPDSLVAVPTYLLDGRVVALGNPRQHDLFGRLERVLQGRAEAESGR